MELQNGATDYSNLYFGKKLSMSELDNLIEKLNHIHHQTIANCDETDNKTIRKTFHSEIFEIPLKVENGIDLNKVVPGLGQIASEFKADSKYTARVKELGQKYLEDGEVRLHGDFCPERWVRSPEGPRIVSPEFNLQGHPEYDWGVFVAHLIISSHSYTYINSVLSRYKKTKSWDQELAWGFCGVEIMRRIMGRDPLQLDISLGRRHELLELSYELLCSRKRKTRY